MLVKKETALKNAFRFRAAYTGWAFSSKIFKRDCFSVSWKDYSINTKAISEFGNYSYQSHSWSSCLARSLCFAITIGQIL